MNHLFGKAGRFAWRTARNLICIIPWGRKILFPPETLARRFGRDDPAYAISVFLHHHQQLSAAGYSGADKILEVGPGRNIGTSLLMWALNHARSGKAVTVILWDVFRNADVDRESLRKIARALLESAAFGNLIHALPDERMDQILGMVARGDLWPDIRYRIQPMPELLAAGEANDLTLVYSQVAIEHIWQIAYFWRAIIELTRQGGWHSHHIDLADHGRRSSNYIEMLEWSWPVYWLTMRFVPGGINRWRASMHIDFLVQNGMHILSANRETRDTLPIPYTRIDRSFRSLDEFELRTTAVDLVAVKIK